MVAHHVTARLNCRSTFECTKTLQTLIKCDNLLKDVSRSSVLNSFVIPHCGIFGDYQTAALKDSFLPFQMKLPFLTWLFLWLPIRRWTETGAIEPERPQQSRRGSAWQKSVLTREHLQNWVLIYIYLLRLVIHVFWLYEKVLNEKREGIPQHLKVCDICFKYLVNEKKWVFICLVLWREASVFLNALVLHFRRGMQSFFYSF